jgi:hypothetical protein
MRKHKHRLMQSAGRFPAVIERTWPIVEKHPELLPQWRARHRRLLRRALRQPLPPRLRRLLASA